MSLVRLKELLPLQCAIGETADTSGLGPDASAWGFKSLIAHHKHMV